MDENQQHSRSYSWMDPQKFVELAQGKSGLEFTQLLAEEGVRYGPFWQTLGVLSFEVLGAGEVLFTARPENFHYNILGSVHGGFSAGLLDSALGTAVHSKLPQAGTLTTVQLNIHYVRPITFNSSLMRCTGKAMHVGRRLATAEAQLLDSQDKLCSHASATFMLF